MLRAAVVLTLALAACSTSQGPTASPRASGSPRIVPGPVIGEVRPGSPAPATPSPAVSVTPAATPRATPEPEPEPAVAADGFSAQLLACASLSGSTCNGQLSAIPAQGSFVALVLLQGTQPGDVIEVVMSGPGGVFPGGPATVAGGDGYYYAQYGLSGLAPGTYEITALRNGQPAVTIVLPKG